MKNKNKKAKKKVAKKAKKPAKRASKPVSQELTIRVAPQEIQPTVLDFLEPIHENKKYAVVKTPFSVQQILSVIKPTPREQIYTRPGKGGKNFTYVTGNYIEKKLNYLFGFMWDFDVVEHGVVGDWIWVKGKLTGKLPGGATISKTQFGRSEIKYKKDATHKPENMLDYGNDLKAAATDSLKKCASLLGIAADVYGKNDYQHETGIIVKDAPSNTVVVTAKEAVSGPNGDPVFLCHECDGIVDEQVANYSKKMYGKILCLEDQKGAKRKQ